MSFKSETSSSAELKMITLNKQIIFVLSLFNLYYCVVEGVNGRFRSDNDLLVELISMYEIKFATFL